MAPLTRRLMISASAAGFFAAAVAFLSLASLSAADARLAISANDGKQLLAGEAEGRTPDSISVIDLAIARP
jgi:hypothetical protein